ncbi:DUF4214 domain-containing protein [Methylobacterium sp. WL12]|uniref:DUF4214 domain-containing protein n=1 Tax=Methylobacterium sp. WL12 TaxID=2603890 RepID=UPI0011C8EE07|nr:DUF4214 domain-containing protein [Methylobacterium sp. WL12]TXM67342.1 DUF4214 domain-containing protein [Methylobacterium sp. WL12]
MFYTGTYEGTIHTYCAEFNYTDPIAFKIDQYGNIDLPYSYHGTLRDGVIDSAGHISGISIGVRSLSLGDLTIPYAATDDGTNFYGSGTSRNGITSTIQARMVETTRETIFGGDVNDLIAGNTANNYVDGGTGADTYALQGSRASYQISVGAPGITTTDNVYGRDGTDTLVNIERLKFSDDLVAFDLSGNSGNVYRLYQAAFARTPDTAGLSHNVHLVDQGISLHDMAAAFTVSGEFQTRYGANASDQDFVKALYNNVLGRDPDPTGNAGWLQLLGSHQYDRAGVLIGFSESPENHGKVDPSIAAGIHLDYGVFA